MLSKLFLWLDENKIPRWLGAVVFGLVISIIILIVVNFGLKTEPNKSVISVTPTQVPVLNPKNLEIAKINLDWLNKNKDERGSYRLSKKCNFKLPSQCEKSLPSNRSGIPVMWARFNYYLATKDKSELLILKQDIDNYANRNKAKLIQNNSWDCKLMFDLWKSNVFSNEEKNKIEKICFDSIYEFDNDLFGISTQRDMDSVIDMNRVKNSIQKDLAIVLKGSPKDKVSSEYEGTIKGNEKYLKQNSLYISDYVSRYLWKNKKSDLSMAYLLFDISLQNYIYGKEFDMGDKCVLGLGALDLYKATADEKFKKLAELEKLQVPKEMNSNNMGDMVKCSMLLSDYYKIIGDGPSLTMKETIMNRVINSNFDGKDFYGNKTGEGGFYAVYFDTFNKDIRDNGVLTGLLIN